MSWQIVPSFIGKMSADQDPKRADRVMEAILRMKKLDLGALKKA